MASSSARTQTTAVMVDETQDSRPAATCPMCHTPATLSEDALAAGGEWRCVRCGQHWDLRRLTAVAAYAAWSVAHDHLVTPSMEAGVEHPSHGDTPADGPIGTP